MLSTDGDLARLAGQLGDRLRARGWRVATAESCTGGWVAKAITDVAGSSQWFECGFVTYSDASKAVQLGVPEAVIAEHGAVSEQTVRAMAAGTLERSGADVVVSVSGIAGPGGGSADKPVGQVWLCWQQRGCDALVRVVPFSGDRESVRRETVRAALWGLVGMAGGA